MDPRGWRDAGTSFLISSVLVTGWFLWLGDVGLDLSDEGFLWYGAVRTLLGDVPLRDFQSYEPGRYYWVAAGAWLLGPGIMGLRISVAAFLALGLTCGLQVAGRVIAHPLWRVAVALLLLTWSFPRHKLFEPALAMAAVWVGVRLAEQPVWRRHLQAGAFVGLAACFGRNHALYAGMGLACVLLWSHWKRGGLPLPRAIVAFAIGGLLGALPLLAMLAFVPGFAESFLESVLFFLRHGANLPLPVRWPWLVLSSGQGTAALGPMAVGLVFLLAPAVIASGLFLAWRGDPERSEVRVVVVAALIGLFYAHHASVRSDAPHLAQAVFPVLLAALAMPVALQTDWRRRAAVWGLVAILSAVVTLTMNPLVVSARRSDLVQHRVGSDVLRVPSSLGRTLLGLERAVAQHTSAEEPLLIVPFNPGLYPILGKRAPVWALNMLWHAEPGEQKEMIRALDLGEVNRVLVRVVPISSRELRFRNSHPLVWKHLESRFERIRDRRLPSNYLLLRRKEAGPAETPRLEDRQER